MRFCQGAFYAFTNLGSPSPFTENGLLGSLRHASPRSDTGAGASALDGGLARVSRSKENHFGCQ